MTTKIYNSKIYTASLMLFSIVSIGVIGFMIISDLNFIDALYMTVITMSTVGFGEVAPLEPEARLFTVFLILMSVAIFGYTISVFTEILASGEFVQQLKIKKVQKKIEKLHNHTIVCGYGRNGQQAVKKLRDFKMPCVVIEKDEELVHLLEEDNILFVEGDATDDQILKKARIDDASGLISTLRSDADNLYVVLSSKQINSNLKIISRASNEASCYKLRVAGANNTTIPDKIGGEHMASLLVTPDLVEFVDCLTISDSEDSANLQEIAISDLPKEYLGKTILDLDLRKKTGCSVIGFKTPEGKYVVNPEANTILKTNSFLIILGKPYEIGKLSTLFS